MDGGGGGIPAIGGGVGGNGGAGADGKGGTDITGATTEGTETGASHCVTWVNSLWKNVLPVTGSLCDTHPAGKLPDTPGAAVDAGGGIRSNVDIFLAAKTKMTRKENGKK